MRNRSIVLAPCALALVVVACDNGDEVTASPIASKAAAVEAPPAAPATVTSAAIAPAAPAAAAAVGDQAKPEPETELRAQLLGLNKKKAPEEVAEASQSEPEEVNRPVRRARKAGKRTTAVARPMAMEPNLGGGGGLSDGEFQDTVNAWRGIKGCIAQNAGHLQERSGALRLSFDIAADGSVADCKVVDTSNAVAQAIAPCVRKKARRLRFPSFDGDQTTKVAKFVF